VTSQDAKSKARVMEKIEKTPEWASALTETMGTPHALGNSEVFEKLKKGHLPTPDELNRRAPEQEAIDQRIEEICKATGRKDNKSLKQCSPLIVIGGPPCQAYSTIGRARRAGIADHNQDYDERFFLYKEYADVIKRARPDLFVMENVSGIGSAKLANGVRIFPEIIKRLEYLKEDPGPEKDKEEYHIYSFVTEKGEFSGSEKNPSDKDFVINAAHFGVPQERRRVILLGINVEHDRDQSLPFIMDSTKAPSAPSIAETISSLPKIRSSISTAKRSSNRDQFVGENFLDSDLDWSNLRAKCIEKIRRIVAGKNAVSQGVCDVLEWDRRSTKFEKVSQVKVTREITEQDLVWIFLSSEEEGIIKSRETGYKRLLSEIYPKISELLDDIEAEAQLGTGSDFYLYSETKKALSSGDEEYRKLENWLANKYFSGTLNHRAKQHMPSDMIRYMFSALWTESQMLIDTQHSPNYGTLQTSISPTTKYFPSNLASQHKSWYSKNFQDRFRCYPRTYRAKTITSHMHKDGHANIHYDAAQIRSLSVREAARLQTFPDDYYFEGGQSAQYLQVGNAVPPFLAKQIAEYIYKLIKLTKLTE
jgi:DNA (cytosine-5)-methyltransferase 1